MSTNVNLIDPNEVISKMPNYLNGMPEYEKMSIFVELTAKRKGRTVLETSNTGFGATKILTGLENDVNISMMGYDQARNTTQHTTRYTFNTTISEEAYEGFGIENIKISVNSSYVPKVTIDFVDIRGNSFAQKKESIYNILFDFPPPIYKLTIKGYYGKALTYELHLVKYNVKFLAETGNYNINAEFVSRTFAPLTDILFKYVETFPLIGDNTADNLNENPFVPVEDPNSFTSDERVAPRNTYELIKKLQSLYDNINKFKDSSAEAEKLNNTILVKNNIKELMSKLNNIKIAYSNVISEEIKENIVFLIENFNKSLVLLPNVATGTLLEYNNFLSANGGKTNNLNSDRRLYIAFKIAEKDSPINGMNQQKATTTLLGLRKALLDDASKISTKFKSTDKNKYITPTVGDNVNNYAYNNTIIEDSTGIQYMYIDITEFYREIYLNQVDAVDTIKYTQGALVNKINEYVEEKLGMKPTIYNFFKIICDDVDSFFDVIKTYSKNAEIHHKTYEDKIIIGKNNMIDKTVTAFPLFIDTDTTECGGTRQTRRMPTIEGLNINDIPEFPEAILVEKFMDAFIDIEKNKRTDDLKSQKDENGNNIWIPTTPADSELYTPTNTDSPYNGLAFSTESAIDTLYSIFLNRFYSQTQFTYGLDYFNQNPDEKIYNNQKNLNQFLARSEAVNIAASITEDSLINKLINDSNEFGSSAFNGDYLSGFTTYLTNSNVTNYSKLNNDEYLTLTNKVDIYRDRANANYVGLDLIYKENDDRDEIAKKIRSGSENADVSNAVVSPVDKFLFSKEENGLGFIDNMLEYVGLFRKDESVALLKEFNSNNIGYFSDTAAEDDFKSIYLLKSYYDNLKGGSLSKYNEIINDDDLTADEKLDQIGDLVIKNVEKSQRQDSTNYRRFTSAVERWGENLSSYGDRLLTYFNEAQDEDDLIIQAMLISSNFFNTSGLFNKYNYINQFLKNPALIEMPYYVPIYMGALVKISKSDSLKEKLITFLDSPLGQRLTIFKNTALIYFDLKKIELLSVNDQNKFEEAFDYFFEEEQSGKFQDIMESLVALINQVTVEFQNVKVSFWDEIKGNDILEQKKDKFVEYLKDGDEYGNITNILNRKIVVMVFSQYTFNDPDNAIPTTYLPLSELIKDNNKREAIKIYFDSFFPKLLANLKKNKEELNAIETKYKSNIDDNDIKTQTYYSFKNINDKWIAGEKNNIKGFPLNYDGQPLISKFAFVDRAMNPIGDEVVINVEPLLEMIQDYDLSIFTVLSRILSHNGFEFFPLQNFMAYENDEEWENSFKIFTTVQDQIAVPSFVCMYIGGTSSFLNNGTSEYQDDGLDLNNLTDVTDFGISGCTNQNEVKDKPKIEGNVDYPYSQVRAFRVRFAEQNQSIFKNINIDSREYPDTNESLQILSKIAQDQSASTPVTKGQNLYNTFETRAYTAQVDMIGDAMIQPTQYFQLENVPIFSGAYIILNVEHNITPNHMTTNFSGVKVLKFPNPFVKEYAVRVGYQGGTSEDISGNNRDYPPQGNTYGKTGASSLPPQAQHDSMYDLTLKSSLNQQQGE